MWSTSLLLAIARFNFVTFHINLLQGSVVALLYCFCNGEVQSEVYRLLPEGVKRKFRNIRKSRERASLAHKHKRASRNGHAQGAMHFQTDSFI